MDDAGIEVAELLRVVDGGDAKLLLLDVRNEEDFATWRIEGRRPFEMMHVPYFDFLEDPEGAIGRLPRDREIACVCAQGGSSAMVVEMLREAGYRAQNLTGGMLAYGAHLEAFRVALREDDADRFEIWQLVRRGKGCLSYVVRAGDEAIVVDPSRHVEHYERFVRDRGARIVRVLDTHVHADHLSGGPSLAKRNGAPYTVSAGEGFELRHSVSALRDDERLRLGSGDTSVEIEVLATPGHTPGSCSYLIEGSYLLSGDTLFAHGVGRPDLGEDAESWARSLFRTLRERLAFLADDVLVLPAHSTGVAEMGPDGVVSARLGDLRRAPALRAECAEFVRGLVAAIHPPPPSYASMIRANLGLENADEAHAAEWELGKNQCATAAGSSRSLRREP